ncbi:Thioredoxin [uncultured Candidatus Thioglobus sp.]|nr:Thioredoxin [uncultured Candidatus Thioglobus sp.]
MKKILIILTLILPLGTLQAITLNEVLDKGKAFFNYKQTAKMPQFSVVDMNGKTHNNNSIKGKYLVVNFWATWCPPCLKEIPDFVEFYDKYKDKVEILGMDYEQANADKITEFTDGFLVNYPIILADERNQPEFDKFGEVLGMPTTFIYAPDGSLIDYHMGAISLKELEKAIQ